MSFERTIERHPHVTRFSFGLLAATFPDGEQCGPVMVSTTGEVVPPLTEFSLPVRKGRFSGLFSPGGGYDIQISGSFDHNDQASGTVSYDDEGDCSTGTVRWTAQPAGQSHN